MSEKNISGFTRVVEHMGSGKKTEGILEIADAQGRKYRGALEEMSLDD